MKRLVNYDKFIPKIEEILMEWKDAAKLNTPIQYKVQYNENKYDLYIKSVEGYILNAFNRQEYEERIIEASEYSINDVFVSSEHDWTIIQ